MPKSTNPAAREHIPYYNGVGLDSIKMSEENGPFMSNGAADFEKPMTDQWIHA